MFSLIITIISIALVAALALATLYYGGAAFQRSQASSRVTALINEGTQIRGALALARAQGAAVSSLPQDLVSPGYLTQPPAGWVWPPALEWANPAASSDVSYTLPANSLRTEICQAINEKAGFTAAMTGVTTDTDDNLYVQTSDMTQAGKTFGCVRVISTRLVRFRLKTAS